MAIETATMADLDEAIKKALALQDALRAKPLDTDAKARLAKNIQTMKELDAAVNKPRAAWVAGASPTCADVLLGSFLWNNVSCGVFIGFSYELSVQDVVIRGELSMDPNVRAPIARDLILTISFLCPPPIDPIANACNPQTITMTTQQADCTTLRTYSIATMVPRGFSRAFNRDAPPAIFSQTFAFMGSMANGSPITITN